MVIFSVFVLKSCVLVHAFTGKARSAESVFDHCLQKLVSYFFYSPADMLSANANQPVLSLFQRGNIDQMKALLAQILCLFQTLENH